MSRKKPGEFQVVNHSVAREDGVAKVTGRAVYASDIRLEGMLTPSSCGVLSLTRAFSPSMRAKRCGSPA